MLKSKHRSARHPEAAVRGCIVASVVRCIVARALLCGRVTCSAAATSAQHRRLHDGAPEPAAEHPQPCLPGRTLSNGARVSGRRGSFGVALCRIVKLTSETSSLAGASIASVGCFSGPKNRQFRLQTPWGFEEMKVVYSTFHTYHRIGLTKLYRSTKAAFSTAYRPT